MPTIASSQTMYNKHTWLLGAHDTLSNQVRAHEIERVAITFSNSATDSTALAPFLQVSSLTYVFGRSREAGREV